MADNIFEQKRQRILLLSGLPGGQIGGQRVPVGGGGLLSERFEDAGRAREILLKAQRKKKKKPSKKARREQRLQAQFPQAAGRISEGNLVFTTPKVEADLKASRELVQLKREKLRILEREREQNAQLEDRRLRIQTEQIRAGNIRDKRQRGLEHRRLNEEARRFDEEVGERDRARQDELRRIGEEQATIRDLNAREDAQRHAEIQARRDQALTELGIRGEERQREQDNERFRIDSQRQVDADRAITDREREATFREVVDLLRHNRAPAKFGGEGGNREPSAIDELIDAVEEVGERAKQRKGGGRQRRGTIVSPAVGGGGGARSPTARETRTPPRERQVRRTLDDESQPSPRRSSRRQTAQPRTTRNTPAVWERRGEGAGRRLYRVEEEAGLPPSPRQSSLTTPQPEPAPVDRDPPGLQRQPSETPSEPVTEVGTPRPEPGPARRALEEVRAQRRATEQAAREEERPPTP